MLVGLVQKMVQVVHTTAHQVSTAETAAYWLAGWLID
jgi:hypothetical protein